MTGGFPPKGYAVDGVNPTVLIFRPGGDAGGNVYTDEASLATATQQLGGGPYTILFDLSLAATPGFYTFSTVGALALAPRSTWTDGGVTEPGTYTNQLTFANGTVIGSPPSSIEGLLSLAVTQSVAVFQANTDTGETVFRDGTSAYSTVGSAPLITSTQGWFVSLDDAAAINYGPIAGSPLPESALAICLNVYAIANDQTYIGPLTAPAIIGPVSSGTFVDPSMYPLVGVPPFFADFTGTGNTTIQPQFAGTDYNTGGILWVQGGSNPGTFYWSDGTNWNPFGAENVPYTPGAPDDWASPAPTTVQQALDRIAANTGNAHPIP